MSSRYLARMDGGPTRYTKSAADKITYLRGVDLTSAAINVHSSRAFNAPNMIRDVPGKVRKRMGYSLWKSFPDRINGIYDYGDNILIHSGTKMYLNDADHLIGDEMADHKSNAYLMYYDANSENKSHEVDVLVILDGTTMWTYVENYTNKYNGLHRAEDLATVPEVTVGRAPNGEGGDSLQMINMLTDRYTDSFLGTAEDTVYQLSWFPLSDESVEAYKINADGEWEDITETISAIDYTTGTVTFSVAPGAPVSSGEDNVRITASSVHEGYKDRVNHCQFGIIYGVNGAFDRLFISGNPDLIDCDWYSASADPFYFGDWNYGEIGKTESPITGYTIVNGYLATHKQKDDTERNCYLRKGEITYDGEDSVDLQTVKFPIVQIIQGTGAVAPGSFSYMTEPMYLTDDGIYATTPYEYNNELYAQKRSMFLDGAIAKEVNKEDAVSISWNDFYLCALNGNVYILDTLQKDSSNITRGSNYQYEAYHWDNVPVRVWYKDRHFLYFGSVDGNIYKFYADKYDGASYNDNGKPISAKWEFMHTGRNIHINKDLKYMALNLAATENAQLDLSYRKSSDNVVQHAVFRPATAYFSYHKLGMEDGYSEMVYGTSEMPKTIGQKLKARMYDACSLTLSNGYLNQGVSIYAIILEYNEGMRYKNGNV